jgi:hypothetical protein
VRRELRVVDCSGGRHRNGEVQKRFLVLSLVSFALEVEGLADSSLD